MADPKVLISELATDIAAVLAGMYLPETRGGMTRKLTGDKLADLINAKLASVSAAATLASVIGVNGSGAIVKATVDTDALLAANSDLRLASQKAVKAYVDNILAVQDAMVFKGVINCSANPNYPAANCGWTYRVSVGGKIGGASGTNVEAGDILLCTTDGSASGTQAAVGANWDLIQVNIDGALTTANLGSTVQGWGAILDALKALTISAGTFIRGTGPNAFAVQDILGAVSQSSGKSTGAIFQRGSGPNGEWTKYADGQMEQIYRDPVGLDVNDVQNSIFRSSVVGTWTFEVPFLAGTIVKVTCDPEASNRWANAYATSVSAAAIRHFAGVQSATTAPHVVTAKGWWI
jgi:hypothetical protein